MLFIWMCFGQFSASKYKGADKDLIRSTCEARFATGFYRYFGLDWNVRPGNVSGSAACKLSPREAAVWQ